MEIDKENLTFARIYFNDSTYNILYPQNIKEFLYGLENDLLFPNIKTLLYNEIKIRMKDTLISLN